MPPAGFALLDGLVGTVGVRLYRASGLANGAGKRVDVIRRRRHVRELLMDMDDVPSTWCHESLGVGLAEVVRVRLGDRDQGPDHHGRVAVDIRQGCRSGPAARSLGASPFARHPSDGTAATPGADDTTPTPGLGSPYGDEG